MKILPGILILIILASGFTARAQYNPYLDKKAKNKPSAVMAKQNRKELKKQKRVAKRQMRRSRRGLNRKGSGKR